MREVSERVSREREKECENESVRESRGVSASGGGLVQDQGIQRIQIKDYWIDLEDSRGLFGSDFRLVVSRDSSAHFIFLDNQLLRWLESSLLVAKDNSWVFPSSCQSRSSRRLISVGRPSKGSSFLKISETCRNGKIFFVLVPKDPNQSGWCSFIRLIQARLGPRPSTVRPVGSVFSRLSSPHRSFAEVTAGRSFPLEGRCSLVRFGSLPGIKVEEHGVKERTSFLECCLVFRFASLENVDWTGFRSWAHLNWGISKEASFSSVGDGLWLLFCGSKEKVSQILALKRWLFGQIAIQMDHWIVDAGRSNVLLEKEVVWVRIRGIPLHLRSPDLFSQIGNTCGSFISFEDGGSLSSVRILVRLRGVLPEEIPICYDGVIFPVRVEPESIISPSCLGDELSPERLWRSKGKASLSSFGDCRPAPHIAESSSPVPSSSALPVCSSNPDVFSSFLNPVLSSVDATSDFSAAEERPSSPCHSQTLTHSSAKISPRASPLALQSPHAYSLALQPTCSFVGLQWDSINNPSLSLGSGLVTFSLVKEGLLNFSLDGSGLLNLSRCIRWASHFQKPKALESIAPGLYADCSTSAPSSSLLFISEFETPRESPALLSSLVSPSDDEDSRSAAISRIASSIGLELKISSSKEAHAVNITSGSSPCILLNPIDSDSRNLNTISASSEIGLSRLSSKDNGEISISSHQSPSSRSRTELELRRI
ncbi:hypothetical protein LINPERHAP2_LOCUS18521 [Linum perenne]